MHFWHWDQARTMYYCARCPVQVPLEVAVDSPRVMWRNNHGRVAVVLDRIAEVPCAAREG